MESKGKQWRPAVVKAVQSMIESEKNAKRKMIQSLNLSNEQWDYVYECFEMMNLEILSHMLFPLSDYENKDEVRAIAEKAGIQVAKKPDSQEICFIPDNDHTNFILNHLPELKKGKIVDKQGVIRGEHDGIIKYTIGQRKGLGISNPTPLFVIKLDVEKNEVVVGNEMDLFRKELIAKDFNLISLEKLPKDFKCTAKIRYAAKPVVCTVNECDNNEYKIIFEEHQRAITSGQSVVLYDGDIVIGGGIIK